MRLDQRLGFEFGRGPLLEVDRERDAERDDEDKEDVREREDESCADLRGGLLCLIGRQEPEPDAPDRRDVCGMRGVILDLLAEPGDVHVERLGRPESVWIPDFVHDSLPA